MELDFQQATLVGGQAILFPDWVFAALAKNVPNETPIITGTSSNSVNITGTIDNT